PSPRRPPLSPVPPAASSRLSLLAGRRPVAPSPPPASQWPPLPRLALRFPRRPPELRSRHRPSLSSAPAASSRLCLPA
ncbi:hypothetical protein EE612_035470, partial [Oryza sativa]